MAINIEIEGLDFSDDEETSRDYTKEVTCPHCDYEFSDSWEFEEDSYDDLECPECKTIFYMERHIEVTYCTSRKRQ